jgi:hypothetical protein
MLIVEKTENLFQGYVPCSPEHLFKFFSIIKDLDRGSFIVFSGGWLLSKIGGGWRLN